jgi:hypothetical protein
MIPSRSKALGISAGLLLLAAAVPGLRLFVAPRTLCQAGGVTLERVDEATVPYSEHLDAKQDDLLLTNGRLEVVVGASGETPARRQDYGAILDVTGPAFADDGLGAIRAVLSLGGKRVPLTTTRVEPILSKDAPGMLVFEEAIGAGVSMTTDIRFSKKRANEIDIVTRVTNAAPHALTVRVGDYVAWPGTPTFAPGHGDVEEAGHEMLQWIARRDDLTYGLVFPDAPADVEFRVQQSETDQTCWAPPVELAPEQTTIYRRALVATRRGASEVERVAAALKHLPLATVVGVLDPAPAWAHLTVVASDGTIALKDEAKADGSFVLALPEGRYTVIMQTPGGYDQATVDARAGDRPTSLKLLVPQAERLDFRITDETGRLMPGRLILVGVDGTPDPSFVSIPRVSAAGNEVHTTTGEGRIDIPPGHYRVIASRGFEWSVVEKRIEVKPEQGVALRIALSHDMPTPGWISADLHLHAKPSSDSELSLDDRIASLVSAGVEFAVATDHNHVTDYAPTIERYDVGSMLGATSGVEITTRTWGHFNAYPLPPKSKAPPWAVDPPEIFKAVRSMAPDAVIQVNHPWMPGYGYFQRSALNERTGAHFRKNFSFDFDLIEVVNGWELGTVDVLGRNLVRYFDLLNLGHRYTAVGSSDSHKLTNEWAGYPRTYIRVPDDRPDRVTAQEIATALKAGHAIVSMGPFVEARIGEAGPGDTVQASPGTVPLDITVRSADWVQVNRVDVIVDGDTVDSFEVGEADGANNVRWAKVVDVPVVHDSWVAVVVSGTHPVDEVLPGLHVAPFAFTNPIYVDIGEASEPPPRRARAVSRTKPEAVIEEPVSDSLPEAGDPPDASPSEPAPEAPPETPASAPSDAPPAPDF